MSARRLSIALPAALLVLAAGTAGCASKGSSAAAPSYAWIAHGNSATPIPPAGFPSEPRVVTDTAVAIVQVSNEPEPVPGTAGLRSEYPSTGSAHAAFGGNATHRGGLTGFDPRIVPACFFMMPVCIAAIVVISAIANRRSKRPSAASGFDADDGSGRPPVTKAQSARMAAAVSRKLQETDFGRRLTPRLALAEDDAAAYPRIVVHLRAANLRAEGNTVQFLLEASAQGQLSPGEGWSPTEHFIVSPRRHAKDWLASEGRQLREDLEAALDSLGTHIAWLYVPAPLKN